ncbi:peptide chain release factor 1, mitochondrial-like isoform X1 [Salvia splendens]|uniref:peptide chain release factor 1, mitochondrial-like isoform X1 n=1 Tax=Salvia splendens TaxID=180675 RepID=UPI001C25E5B3|nr:peptide chain release factor 1, mitochondrial-like isoform X1 [Salvia splendens]
MSKRAAFWKSKLYEFHSHFFNRPIIVYRPPPQHRRIHLLTAKTLFRRLYSARAALSQSQPQLSNDLINIMEHKLSAIENRHAQLEAILNQPDASPEEYSTANKELKKLRHTIDVVSELRKKQQEIGGLKSLIDEADEDKDMREMAADELGQASQEEERLRYMLLKSLLPKDDVDERDCILEVRAGTGGEEASLFAMDIFKMYEKYSQNKGWRFEVLGVAESDIKGYKVGRVSFRFHVAYDCFFHIFSVTRYCSSKCSMIPQEASAAISGADVYGKLKFESGIHRVQRVPMTEKSGRVHTSAVSVVILPQADQVDVQIRNEDLKIDTYRSGGSGGQSVNTTDSAVRITHIPTGLVVAIQDERSQHQNKAKALKVLCAKLYELERTRLDANRSKLRTEQIGSGDRSERIRTYNFPQGRVTDHRVGITSHAIDDIMEGEDLDTFVDALILQQEMDAIASFTST